MKEIRHGALYDSLPNFNYTYDKAGNVFSLTTQLALGTSDTQNFDYDHLHRLISASGSGNISGVSGYSHSYQYAGDNGKLGNMTSYAGTSYTYSGWPTGCNPLYPAPSQALPHAVKQAGSDYYCYDKNGNMTIRTVGTTIYTQLYDVENRLTQITQNNSTTVTRFNYDATGQRTKTEIEVPGSLKTIVYYPFPGYEEEVRQSWQPCGDGCEEGSRGKWVTTATIKHSTYFLAGQSIARRTTGDPITGYKNSYIKLIYINARFYIPNTNRFLTPDSIIPDPADPQSYNRYTYTRNNPINLVDPTGHRECGLRDLDCDNPIPHPIGGPLVTFSGDFNDAERVTFEEGAAQVAQALFEVAGEEFNSSREVFMAVYGGAVEIRRTGMSCQQAFKETEPDNNYTCYASASAHHINIYTNADGHIEGYTMWVMHELFHSFNANAIPAGENAGQPYLDLTNNPVRVNDKPISPYDGMQRDLSGYRPGGDFVGDRTPYVNSWDDYGVGEDFADMGANWAANSFAHDDAGIARYNWMDNRMKAWIDLAVANNQ